MHEISIMESTLKIVLQKAEENDFKTVKKITLKIGELAGVMIEALEFAFEECKRDTILNGTELCINKVKAAAYCDVCNIKYPINHFNKVCPRCGKTALKIISGYELYLESIEGESSDS